MAYGADILARAARIKLVVMDVDGTMTDGRIYFGPAGEAFKAFSVKDGMGIALLHKAGLKTGIITGRTSEIVAQRAAELKMYKVFQGVADKRESLQQMRDELGLSNEEIAYIGDDLNDLPLMLQVGLACCTADARPEVREICHVISDYEGGNGAVRDIAELILKAQDKWQPLVDLFMGPKKISGHAQ